MSSLPPPHMLRLSHSQHSSPVHTFMTTNEPTLAYHNHSESIGYINVHYWYCTVYGFGQMYNIMYFHHYRIIHSIFTALRRVYFIQLCAVTTASKSKLFYEKGERGEQEERREEEMEVKVIYRSSSY